MLKVLDLLLAAVLPLLERRTLAAERQAEYTERTYSLLRQYLGYSDPEFLQVLEGGTTAAQDAAAEPADVYAEHGLERDQKAERLEVLRTLWFANHGELLDDERLMEEYDRLYTESVERMNPDQEARH